MQFGQFRCKFAQIGKGLGNSFHSGARRKTPMTSNYSVGGGHLSRSTHPSFSDLLNELSESPLFVAIYCSKGFPESRLLPTLRQPSAQRSFPALLAPHVGGIPFRLVPRGARSPGVSSRFGTAVFLFSAAGFVRLILRWWHRAVSVGFACALWGEGFPRTPRHPGRFGSSPSAVSLTSAPTTSTSSFRRSGAAGRPHAGLAPGLALPR